MGPSSHSQIHIFFLGIIPEVLLLVGGASLVFLVGILDDFIHLKPYSKLIGQIVAAALGVALMVAESGGFGCIRLSFPG